MSMKEILSYSRFYCGIKNDLAFNKLYSRGKFTRAAKAYQKEFKYDEINA